MKEYFIAGEKIKSIYDLANKKIQAGESLQRTSAFLLPLITTRYDIEGLENIPKDGPIILASNHPSHFDYFLALDALLRRPDMKMVARVPTEKQESVRFPSRREFLMKDPNIFPVHSEESGLYVEESLELLKEELRNGLSILLVPWGCMDHQVDSRKYPAKKAVLNIQTLSAMNKAAVITVLTTITLEKDTTTPELPPFSRVIIKINDAIPYTDEREIEWATKELYGHAI